MTNALQDAAVSVCVDKERAFSALGSVCDPFDPLFHLHLHNVNKDAIYTLSHSCQVHSALLHCGPTQSISARRSRSSGVDEDSQVGCVEVEVYGIAGLPKFKINE